MTNQPWESNQPGDKEDDGEQDNTSNRDPNSSDGERSDTADCDTESDQLIQTNGGNSHDSSASKEPSAHAASQAGVAQSDDKEQTFMPLLRVHAFLPGTPIESKQSEPTVS